MSRLRSAAPSPAAARSCRVGAAPRGVLGTRRALPVPQRSTIRSSRPAVCAAAGQQQAGQQQRTGQQAHERLQDPAKLSGASKASVTVQDRGGALSLDAYMRLPTEQYHELDPAMISSLGGSAFLLRVPRVSLFDVWVEPEVVVHVSLGGGAGGPDSVVFESGECRLKGSELLQSLELDKRFVLYFHTALTWQPSGGGGGGGGSSSANGGHGSNGGGGNGGGAVAAAGQGSINAMADVQVWSEVVGPFRVIPRPMLQATGNAVMGAMMKALLPVFLAKLGDDYARWSTNLSYRARRAATVAQPQQPGGAAAPAQ
ncbi:hypothetical protein C2E20_8943 [Micractinium conductrix]|uniref:Uncharacterized protein n=1 Tax=Micractinium conductrix TaxID=554055 RepID=A0A2P6UZU6_9CHLO|nr:hypothetical protein C2E20_8943 [Micractinium conductrix]|eukprot:PSC67368.1 hypothetical protein C2E20_8943 [Micractinium conductrix]